MRLRHAIRSLRHSPGYTAACVAVLALGIGANTAIFSLLYDAILKPLPYPDSGRLVLLCGGFPSLPEPLSTHMPVARFSYEAWRTQARSFDEVEAFHEDSFRENGVDRPRVLGAELVSAGLLPLLGGRPQAGRLFHADEDTPGADHVVILSDRYFEQRFNRDRAAIGTTISFGSVEYTVVGALTPEFELPPLFGGDDQNRPDVYIPLSRGWTRPDADRNTSLNVVARLRAGVRLDQARDDLKALAARLHQDDAERYPMGDAYVYAFQAERASGDLSPALYVLFGAVGLVLLIGCANLVNLTLARSARRSREIAVRRALGASRTAIVGQLLTEALLLAAVGALAGLAIGWAAMRGLLALAPENSIRQGMGSLSIPVFLFAAIVAAGTALLFGLAPAVSASSADLNGALKSGGRGGSAGGRRSRRVLIGAEVAMALVLLSGAGLLFRSFVKVIRTDLGFDVDHLIAVDLDLPEYEYPDADGRARLLETIVDTARAVPGVSLASMGDALPLHRVSITSFEVVGQPPLPPGQFITADYANVLPGYLDVLGVPLLAGRSLTMGDVAAGRGTGEGAVAVNRAFVDTFLPSVDPLAQRLKIKDRVYAIAGVVANFRALGAEEDVRPQFFLPGVNGETAILVLRSPLPADAVSVSLRNVLASVDENLSTARIRTMDDYVDEWLQVRRFGLVLLSVFAGLALVLAMIGVNGVLANLVAARTREIGIRLALGATPTGIARLMAVQSLTPVAIGAALGLAGSAALGVVIRSMLFQVPPYDPVTLVLAMLAIVAATPLAIWWPIRRATRVECTVALREE